MKKKNMMDMMKKFAALTVAFVMLAQSTLAPVALSIRSDVVAATIGDLHDLFEDITLTVITPEATVPYDGYDTYGGDDDSRYNDDYYYDYDYDKDDDYYYDYDYDKDDDYYYDYDYDKDDDYYYDYDYDKDDDYYYDEEYEKEDDEAGAPVILPPVFLMPANATEANLRVDLFWAEGGNPNYSHHLAGEEIVVFLSVEYSMPIADVFLTDYVPPTVRIPINNDNVILVDFINASTDENGNPFISIFAGHRMNDFRIVHDVATGQRAIEFMPNQGTIVIPFSFIFPNGITYREELRLEPFSSYENDNEFSLQDMDYHVLHIQSVFGWDVVTLTFTTVTLNGVDVLGHDGTNGFDIVDIATNLSDAPYTMVINLDTSQGNQDGNSQGGNNQGNNNDQGNRRPSGDGNQQ